MNKILTISVAAYNIEKYIKQNLDSFVNSDVKELIEVIVVDDESTDSTTQIVQEYVEKYPDTIKLIKQKNTGPGSTINNAIKHATGKYFKVIDGDDWVETRNLNVLVRKLCDVDVDMIITNHNVYDNSKNKVIKNINFNIEADKEFKLQDICKSIYLEMYNVLYKTSILKENKITLDNGFYTDVEFLLLPIPFVKNVIYYDFDIYVYRIARKGQSVSLEKLQKNLNMHHIVLTRLITYYEEVKENLPKETKYFIANRISGVADMELSILLTFETNKENKKNIKKYFKEIKETSTDIYKKIIKTKKSKILLYSHYILYKLANKIVIKKFKKVEIYMKKGSKKYGKNKRI